MARLGLLFGRGLALGGGEAGGHFGLVAEAADAFDGALLEAGSLALLDEVREAAAGGFALPPALGKAEGGLAALEA